MINVINVTTDSNIGGAGRCILTFLKKFDRNKFNVSVVVPAGSALIPYIKKENIAFFEFENLAEQSFSFSAVRELSKFFKSERPDIIHAHACMSARIAAKLCGIKTIYTRHSVFPNSPRITKGIGKLLCGFINNHTCDKVIAVAQAAKDNVVETGVDPDRVTVIKNGVLPVEKSDASEFKNTYKISDEFIFGMIARVEKIKGHDIFIDAAKILISEGCNAKFLICGTGGYFDSVKERIRNENLSENIILTGHIDNIKYALNAIDVNVNASFGTEATSLSLLEGMSLGKPIIASDYGGNPELVISGYNGLLFKSEDSNELAKCMKMLYNDRKIYEKLSNGAEEDFYKKYTADIYCNNIQNIYIDTLCKEKKDEKI